MKDIFLLDNFNFNTIVWDKYHYTDNRAGSPSHYLAHMEKGNAKIVSKQITINISEGEVFYIPDALSYQSYWFSINEVRFKSLGFRWFPESEERQFLLQKISCNKELKEKIKSIPTGTSVNSGIVGEFYSALNAILPNLKFKAKDTNQELIEKAKRFIDDQPLCKVSDVARYLLISESAIYHTFKKVIGITPNALIQKVRCEKAVQLLTTTNKSIQEISDILKFSSTAYFRKVLLKNTNKTPSQIRKSVDKI